MQVGKGLKTKQIGFLLTQQGNAAQYVGIVIRATGAAAVVCLVEHLAQVTTCAVLHEWTIGRSQQRELVAVALQRLAEEVGQTLQILLWVELIAPFARGLLYVLTIGQGEAVHLALYLAPTFAGLALQGGTCLEITVVTMFQQSLLLGGQSLKVLGIIFVPYALHALEELLVQRDVEAMLAQDGLHLLGQGQHVVCAVAFYDVVCHAQDLTQQVARIFQRLDGVLEGRFLGVVDNGGNLLVLQFDALQHSWLVVLGLDFVEGDSSVVVTPILEERVVHTTVIVFASAHQSECDYCK